MFFFHRWDSFAKSAQMKNLSAKWISSIEATNSANSRRRRMHYIQIKIKLWNRWIIFTYRKVSKLNQHKTRTKYRLNFEMDKSLLFSHSLAIFSWIPVAKTDTVFELLRTCSSHGMNMRGFARNCEVTRICDSV